MYKISKRLSSTTLVLALTANLAHSVNVDQPSSVAMGNQQSPNATTNLSPSPMANMNDIARALSQAAGSENVEIVSEPVSDDAESRKQATAIMAFPQQQLQANFRHTGWFGVNGPEDAQNLSLFNSKLIEFLRDPGTVHQPDKITIEGITKNLVKSSNSEKEIEVITDSQGNLVSIGKFYLLK